MFARSPQRLPDGDTLITDSANKRILVVRTADYEPSEPDQRLHAEQHRLELRGRRGRHAARPQHGASGDRAGRWPARSSSPTATSMRSASSSSTTPPRRSRTTFDMRTFDRPSWATSSDASSPREARVDAKGALWIADAGFGQVLRVGYPVRATRPVGARSAAARPGMIKKLHAAEGGCNRRARRHRILASSTASTAGLTFRDARPSGDGRNFGFPGRDCRQAPHLPAHADHREGPVGDAGRSTR